MTKTYTYQYRFIPHLWKCPTPPSITEQEDMQKTLTYRRLVAVYLRKSLDFFNTWRTIIKYTYPISIIAFAMGSIGWLTFLILSFIVAIISVVIWVKIKIFHRRVNYIQILIDEIIFIELGVRLPKILEDE